MAKKQKKETRDPKYRVNDEIRHDGVVRITGEGIESRVVMLSEAMSIAGSMGLDLVEINRTSDIPILRICNYEKMMYDSKKMAKKNARSQKPMKEIQLSASIAKNDIDTKVGRAKKFLEDGHKVKVVLTLRGREMAHREENKKSILAFLVALEDICVIEFGPNDEGNRTTAILRKKG